MASRKRTLLKVIILGDSGCVPAAIPPQLDPALLLGLSPESTSDPKPAVGSPGDTAEARQVGWEKAALLVSYFFPEHEEPVSATEVVWSSG